MTRAVHILAACCAVLSVAVLWAEPAGAAQIRKGYAMCRDKGSLHRMVEASVANDAKTVEKLMKGPCTVIRKTQKVRVISKGATVANIAIGKRGRWWTVVEAVQ